MRSATCHAEKKHYSKGLCEACYMREFRRVRPEYRAYMKRYLKEWRKLHPEYEKGRKRKHNPIVSKRSSLKCKYGLTLEAFKLMIADQCGMCRICLLSIDVLNGVVDHDHATGIVRGVLCQKCNSGLGFFRDSEDIMLRAISYLGTAKDK